MIWFVPATVELRTRFAVEDRVLTDLHARAFGNRNGDRQPWAARLERHSLTWVGAFADGSLVGFVHACWDGGAHAFLLDAIVDPDHQRHGIGKALVRRLVSEVKLAGCEWVHVDYEPQLAAFYEDECGFRTTSAALLRIDRAAGSLGQRGVAVFEDDE
jgi:GNAT superfamily N-acetyltransferase